MGSPNGSPPLPDGVLLRATVLVRADDTTAQLTFAPGTEFRDGAKAVTAAIAALQAEHAQSRNCPASRKRLRTRRDGESR